MPTHEFYAEAYNAMGVTTYSSAVYYFVPASRSSSTTPCGPGDAATMSRLLTGFFYPFEDIRDRQAGYAVSAIKAGVRLKGFAAGPVRSPLTDMTEEEEAMLAALVARFDVPARVAASA